MTLPRVLIIGQAFNNTGGGITQSNLFKGWDKDKLAVACVGAIANVDTRVCDNYYRLGEKERRALFPFNFLQKKYASGKMVFEEKKSISTSSSKPPARTRFIMGFFLPFLKFMGLSHIIFRTKVSTEFMQWIKEFKPDLIYGQASSRDGLLFCAAVHDHLKIPLVFHMMDDWPSVISYNGFFKKYWHDKIDAEFKDLLDRADVLMSIGDEMSSEYKKRYKKTFIPFQNPVDTSFWGQHQKRTFELSDLPSILYAGRIGLGISSSIEAIAGVLKQMNETLNLKLRLVLYTDINPEWTSKYTCVEFRGIVQHKDLPKLFSEADFLLLPYDFSDKSIKYIKYSMPTKGPEYMISGTPMIIFAPAETAIVKYAEKHGFGQVITSNQPAEIYASIRQLLESRELRQDSANRAIRVAELYHNSMIVTNNFRSAICSAVLPEPKGIKSIAGLI